MDVHTKEQRSKNMSAIRGSNNRSTELAMLALFRSKGIKGWRRCNKKLPGTPDFIFLKKKIAVFVDGCFWHGCSKHCIIPKSRIIFWENKIKGNIKRDKNVRGSLQKLGWKVLRIWEHEIKENPGKAVGKIIKFLK